MTLRAVSSGAASGGQNASYIAGTWLPVVTASVTNGTPVYSIQVGSYEIIGRQVMARFTIALTGWGGTPSGSVQISLPVPSINISNEFGGGVMDNYTIAPGLSAGSAGLIVFIAPGGSIMTVQTSTIINTPALTVAQSGLTPSFVGWCGYRAS